MNQYDDDPQLLEQISQGNKEALGEFLNVNRRALLSFLNKRLGDHLKKKVEVDDLFQEVSAEAFRTLSPEYPGDREPFSWLCQIAERKIIDTHRHHFETQKRDAAKEKSLDGGGGSSGEQGGLVNMLVKSMTTPSAAFSRNAREARLYDAIAQLNEEQQQAVRMKYVENKPSKEIAAALGKSDAAVRVMLTRTMRQLHELLADFEK